MNINQAVNRLGVHAQRITRIDLHKHANGQIHRLIFEPEPARRSRALTTSPSMIDGVDDDLERVLDDLAVLVRRALHQMTMPLRDELIQACHLAEARLANVRESQFAMTFSAPFPTMFTPRWEVGDDDERTTE